MLRLETVELGVSDLFGEDTKERHDRQKIAAPEPARLGCHAIEPFEAQFADKSRSSRLLPNGELQGLSLIHI